MMQCNNLAAACATSHLVHSLRCFYVTQMEVLFFYKVISHSTKADEENRHVNQQRQAPHQRAAGQRPEGERTENQGRAQQQGARRVLVEQYAIGANIEAETASNIARTMIIPAVAKHLVLLGNAEAGALETESRELFDELIDRTKTLEAVNQYPDGIEEEGLELAKYARDKQLTAMHEVRVVADKLERIVADEFWPLPKYSEMLFVK